MDTEYTETNPETVVDTLPTEALANSEAAEVVEKGESIYDGVHRALKDVLSSQNRPAEPTQRQQFFEPATEAIAAMDLRDELFDEIRDIVAEAPKEVRDEVRKNMRQFQNFQSLQIVRQNNLHKTIADAAIGKAVREGKYVPPSARGAGSGVSREPVHSEPATKIPSDFRREQEEVCRVLGVTLTEAEMQSAWRNR